MSSQQQIPKWCLANVPPLSGHSLSYLLNPVDTHSGDFMKWYLQVAQETHPITLFLQYASEDTGSFSFSSAPPHLFLSFFFILSCLRTSSVSQADHRTYSSACLSLLSARIQGRRHCLFYNARIHFISTDHDWTCKNELKSSFCIWNPAVDEWYILVIPSRPEILVSWVDGFVWKGRLSMNDATLSAIQ